MPCSHWSGSRGEDDLDAPDLLQRIDPGPQNGPPIKVSGSNGLGVLPPAKPLQGPRKANGRPAPILSAEASAILREKLLAELEELPLKEDPDAWTLRAWPKVNTLTPEDGDWVRVAFLAQLTRLREAPNEDVKAAEPDPAPTTPEPRSRIDKSVLALPEPRRLRDKQHLRFVAKQPCLVCGREPSDPHHLRFAQPRGLAQKVSDEFTVPLSGHIIASCTAPDKSGSGGREKALSHWRPHTACGS
jgi:hypothetical protein